MSDDSGGRKIIPGFVNVLEHSGPLRRGERVNVLKHAPPFKKSERFEVALALLLTVGFISSFSLLGHSARQAYDSSGEVTQSLDCSPCR